MERVVTIEVGNLFQILRTHMEKDTFPKRPQNFERVTSQARSHWRNKIEAGVQVQSSREHLNYGHEVSAETTPVKGLLTDPLLLLFIRWLEKALYEPLRQPVDSPQVSDFGK